MNERTATDYASHILEAIDRIETYTGGMSEAAFLASQLVQDAVIRNFEVIGEATGNLVRVAPGIATAHPEIPWHLPRKMRNFLTHVYWSVDAAKVWKHGDDRPAWLQAADSSPASRVDKEHNE